MICVDSFLKGELLMSQTYQSRRRMGTAPVQGNAPAQAFAPAQAAASMIGNQSMEALMTGTQANTMENGASRLDEVMQQRVREHFLGNQIPQAEQEADRLAAQVKDAHTPEEVKSQLGDQLGADFSGVRFHTGAQAQQMADGIGARAYTAGNDVYFGQGGFDPSVAAHELVHTAQQGVVDSSVSTVAAPMGGVQMMPKFLSKIGNGIKQGARKVLNFGRAGGRMISDASHWVGNKAQAAGSWLGGKARAAGSWIGDKARAFGQGVKGLFRSKEDRNLETLNSIAVPSRAGEQQPHIPFTPEQIEMMKSNSRGIRGDNTVIPHLAPAARPLAEEFGDIVQGMDDSGFNYETANKNTKVWEVGGMLGDVSYNKSNIAGTKKLMQSVDQHMDRPEMQAVMREVYANEMENTQRQGLSNDEKESMVIKDLLVRGIMPAGEIMNHMNKDLEEDDDRNQFLRSLYKMAPKLEAMYEKRADAPRELQELLENYAPMREKMLGIMRNNG